MILKERLEILNDLFKSAKEVLSQYSAISQTAVSALARAEAYMNIEEVSPKEILDLYKRIHDMQMQSLNTFNSIIEKFPVEHTIQELQLLEIFRNLTERQKQSLMTYLEEQVLSKRQR